MEYEAVVEYESEYDCMWCEGTFKKKQMCERCDYAYCNHCCPNYGDNHA